MFFSIARRTALLALAIVANSALANPGDPDPTFGDGGISQVGSGFERDFPVALVQQADGKLIELRLSTRNQQGFFDMPTPNGTLVRYNVDGSPDFSFGMNATVSNETAALAGLAPGSALVQPDGKIITIGRQTNAGISDITRFNIDGTVDTSFGFFKIDPSATIYAASLQSDGKLLLGGIAFDSQRQLPYSAVFLRYQANGQLESKVVAQGLGSTTIRIKAIKSVLLDSSGRMLMAVGTQMDLVGGSTTSNVSLTRYLPDGTLDANFGNGGIVAVPGIWTVSQYVLGLSPNGDILVAGSSVLVPTSNGLFLARYLDDGSPDPTFGSSGAVTTVFNDFGADGVIKAVAVQSMGDGRIFALVFLGGQLTSCSVLARYNVDGSLDTAFGNGTGKALFPGCRDTSLLLVQADGKPVIAAASSTRIVRLQGGDAWDVIEYYYPRLDHYFMSSLQPDIQALDSGHFPGWVRTGHTFKAYPAAISGTSPVCRFYLPPSFGDSHFYSASPTECAQVAQQFPGFDYESPNVMYIGLPDPVTGACPAATSPVYRLWDKRVDTNHRYTTDPIVRDQMRGLGWVLEGYGAAAPNLVVMCAPSS